MPPVSTENAAARLAGLLDSGMGGIVSVDDQQRIVLCNRAQLLRGEVRVESEPGRGILIEARIPLAAVEAQR